MMAGTQQIKSADKTEEEAEILRSLKVAESGSAMRRLQFRQLGSPTIIKLSSDHSEVSYSSTNNSFKCIPTKFKSVKIREILEVRAGWNTDNFQRTISKSSFTAKVKENWCFSLVYRHPKQLRKSVDFVTESADVQKAWVKALFHLLTNVKKEAHHFNEENWLREHFQQADVNNNGILAFNEVFGLLGKLNLEINKDHAKEIYEKADYKKGQTKTLDQGLEFDEFLIYFRVLTKRKDLLKVLRIHSTDNSVYFSSSDLKNFIENVQKVFKECVVRELLQKLTLIMICQEPKITLEECENLIKQYEPADINKKECTLTVQGFRNLLISREWGSIFSPEHERVIQNMKLPLVNYYISSSHNTYLAGHQLTGNATIEGYINVLHKGFRFLELDIWDGDKGEPTITHGHTLVNPIKFRDVIKAINEYGFKMSEYPVILTLENHCSSSQQHSMAQILRDVLGSKLYVPPPDCTELPSPEELKKKVMLKGKIAKYITPTAVVINSPRNGQDLTDDDTDSGTEITAKIVEVASKGAPKVPLGYELSHITALPACKMLNMIADLTAHPYNGMVSLEEKKINRYVKDSFSDLVRYTSHHFVKVYPRGLRAHSSNYNPMPSWNSGAQCVSLNAQTMDEAYDLNQGLFSMNGQCGYVLKPEALRNGSLNLKEFNNRDYQLTIHLTVISAQFLPKPTTTLAPSDVIDPFVSIEIFGLPCDQQKRVTKVISNNGFNPNWEESFDIKLKAPEHDLIRFSVKDYDKFSSNDFIGEYSMHVISLKEGYRHIRLNTGYAHLEDPTARLFVKIELEKHDIVTIVPVN